MRRKQDVIQALGYTEYIGERTHTASALRRMRTEIFTQQNGDRDDVPNYAIVITDGLYSREFCVKRSRSFEKSQFGCVVCYTN